MITKTHHHFLLFSSPWPLIQSMNSFNLLLSFSLFLKFSLIFNFISSFFVLFFCSFFWWSEYLKEFSFLGMNSMNLEEGIKMSMILFISSEVFFFFSFFWSYFHYFLSPSMEVGLNFPSSGIIPFEAMNVPFFNTLILLLSGILVTISHYFFNSGEWKFSNFFLSMTVILGFIFTYFQFQEYKTSFFCISDSNFGTSFFTLTGFHGIHVLIGSIFLLVTLVISIFPLSTSKMSFLSFELACWYWHFVDVVWIFLFFFLYYLNNLVN